ncbi:MAG: GNAT family N-acetyltransferase [Bradyrhizobium sp.]|uniref:acyl-homoserine-lactone synthase n=1 Tax=Bradyrhizobium sp. TaxID=376 RepID=UPI001C2A09D7|nr:acyl-homoserine-lactone synthase [Bradyrhizobium sp.]MBU6464188.1 GNAT family N-acetyltransferase [Pseudomonadota bacterium]MDE2067900.1 GNAT family N-acetyltransferase [Bradyrhizobium sp.]MDE2242511.1 GNAT family N-acetyltransferase [Bradyrhizobium sp.]MDE2468597.1 GNAT family N-acetyltransferase [Bradyrhizobium sp.]
MGIHIVTAENIGSYAEAMEQAYRLRHAVFVEEMGWNDLRRPDGREIDQFDDGRAVHILYLDGDQLVGYQRMLPSMRPHLLSEVMPHLCDGDFPVGPHIWEWTRYCVTKEHRDRGRMLSLAGNLLLSAIVEWGLESGVSKIIIEMNPIWLLRLVQLHFRVTPLGIPQKAGKDSIVAVTAAFDSRTLARLRDVRGDNRRAITVQPAIDRRVRA